VDINLRFGGRHTPEAEAVKRALQQRSGVVTVPQVFLGGQFLGDGDGIDGKHSAGLLAPLLRFAAEDAAVGGLLSAGARGVAVAEADVLMERSLLEDYDV